MDKISQSLNQFLLVEYIIVAVILVVCGVLWYFIHQAEKKIRKFQHSLGKIQNEVKSAQEEYEKIQDGINKVQEELDEIERARKSGS